MTTFQRIDTIVQVMGAFPSTWYVAGGWAIDLFVDQVTRDHEDVEIAINRRDQQVLQTYLADWTWQKATPREGAPPDAEWELRPWLAGEWLLLPIHQAYARSADSGIGEIGFFLNDVENGQWRFRRNPTVQRPEEEVGILSHRDIPIIVPEIMLAYKAKLLRPKDEHDFAVATPLMTVEQRSWLMETLKVCHPDHPWISKLSANSG